MVVGPQRQWAATPQLPQTLDSPWSPASLRSLRHQSDGAHLSEVTALNHKRKEPGEPGGKFPGGEGRGARKVSMENGTFAVVPSRPPSEGTAVSSQGSPSAPPHRRNKPRFPIGGYHFLLPEETLLSPFPRSLHLPCPRPGGCGDSLPPAPSEQGLKSGDLPSPGVLEFPSTTLTNSKPQGDTFSPGNWEGRMQVAGDKPDYTSVFS